MPAWIERWLLRGVPYVLDYDDAIFHNYDQHRIALVRGLWSHRIDRLMAGARTVVVGNEYLAERAIASNANAVEIIPTVVDLTRYSADNRNDNLTSPPRIIWMGSPGTARYLERITPALANLAQRHPFVLRVVGAKVSMPGVLTECIAWEEDTEAALIASSCIGIMPLSDTPWERGKCGYKLIQYMASGLPVVASPVGVNRTLAQDGATGFLAADERTWIARLEQLLGDAALRNKLGSAGRLCVERTYCVQQISPRLAELLQNAKVSRTILA